MKMTVKKQATTMFQLYNSISHLVRSNFWNHKINTLLPELLSHIKYKLL